MSYPPPLYDGASGEVSATITRDGAEPDLVYPNGNRVTYLAEGLDRLARGEKWTPEEYDRFMAEHDNVWTD